jgi:hypothetical protein
MEPEGKQEEKAGRFFLYVVVPITLLFLALIRYSPSWLIGTPEYHWPVLHHGLMSRLPAAVLILSIAAGIGLLMVAGLEGILAGRYGRARVYASLMLLGLAFQLGPAAVHRMGFLEFPLRVYLPDHTSYFTDAAGIKDLEFWLETYPDRIAEMATHTRTHPPGAVLLFYGAQKLMERMPGLSAAYVRAVPRSHEAMEKFGLSASQAAAGGLCAMVLLMTAAAAVPITFAIGRIITSDKPAAMAALLFAAAPGFSHKTPVLDHAQGALILLSLWLVISAVSERQIWRIAVAGAVIGCGLWIGAAMIAAPPLCLIYAAAAVCALRREDIKLKELVILIVCFIILIAGIAGVVAAGLGLAMRADYLEIYRAIIDTGWRMNNTLSGRTSAWMWIAFNPYEFLAWSGAPLAATFILAVYLGVRRAGRGEFRSGDYWLAALVVFLVALNLSGKVCYEASRLAWFCFPLIAIAASRIAPLPGPGKSMVAPAVILGLQILSAIVFRMIF